MNAISIPPPANYDEALVDVYELPPLSLDRAEPVPRTPEAAASAQAATRALFARALYGEVPARPDRLDWVRKPLPSGDCEQVSITLEVGGREMSVDAALWLPTGRGGPVPIVVGLDFLGPIGSLPGSDYPLDSNAIVVRPQWLGGGEGPLIEVMRGVSAYRFPMSLLQAAGYAVLTSCYGSWVPDNPEASRQRGVWPLLDLDHADAPLGIVSLWARSLGCLVDIATALPEVDTTRISLAGHSRLGKAALWAAVNDQRVSALFLNESGCGGAALSRRNYGETLAHMRHKFPHWLLSADEAAAAGYDGIDQHQLLALMAPRRLYVASAADDLWCDPRGEYLSLKAAAPMWSAFGMDESFPESDAAFSAGSRIHGDRLGWHLRAGGHELTPHDWAQFLDFLADQRPTSL